MTAPRMLEDDRRPSLQSFRYVLPTLEPARPQGGLVSSGIRTGWNELQSTLGSAVEATGQLTGIRGLQQWGAEAAANQMAEADRYRRTDLEGSILQDGVSGFLPRLGYQVAKQIPNVVGTVATAALAPEALALRVGGMLPSVLGGGGAIAGRAAIGAAAMGYPQAVGSMYGEATSREAAGGTAATRDDALKAFAMGVPYAALDVATGTVPFVGKLLEKGAAGGLAKRTLSGIGQNFAQEGVQEGVQTAMEQSFRTDLTAKEKFSNIVDGAVTGAFVGGVFGGVTSALTPGVKETKSVEPSTLQTEDLNAVVDQAIGGPIAQPPIPERKALPAGTYRMGPAGSSSTAPQDLMTPYEPPAPVTPPALSPDAPVGAQGDLFGGPELVTPSTVEIAPAAASPVQDPAQGNLLAEQEAQQEAIQQMQSVARGTLGRMAPFIKKLTAQDPVELVMQVEDAVAGKTAPRAAIELAQKFGILDQSGRRIDLAKMIEKETARLWKIAPDPATATPAQQRKFAAQQRIITTLQAQQRVLAEVAQRRAAVQTPAPAASPVTEVAQPAVAAPAAPVEAPAASAAPVEAPVVMTADGQTVLPLGDVPIAPVATPPAAVAPAAPAPVVAEQLGLPLEAAPAAPVAVPTVAPTAIAAPAATEPAVAAPAVPDVPATREQQVTAMRERARQIVGRKTAFIAKLDAATDEEMRALITQRLEKGSAANDTMKLAEAFGIDLTAPAAPVVEATPAPAAAPLLTMTPAAPAATQGSPAPAATQSAPASVFTTKQDRSDPMQTVQAVMENGTRTGYTLRRANVDAREAPGMGVYWEVITPDGRTVTVLSGGKKAALEKAQAMIVADRAAQTPASAAPTAAPAAAPAPVETPAPTSAPAATPQAPPAATVATSGPVREAPTETRTTEAPTLSPEVVEKLKQLRIEYNTAVMALRSAQAQARRNPSATVKRTIKETTERIQKIRKQVEALTPAPKTAATTEEAPVATPAPKKADTSWLQMWAGKNADVPFVGDGIALVRDVNKRGETIYVPLKKGRFAARYAVTNTAAYAEQDRVDRGFTPEQIETLRQEAVRLEAEDARLAALYPDGPFTGTTSNVVAKFVTYPQIEQNLIGYVSGLLNTLKLTNARVVIVNMADVRTQRDSLKLYGKFAGVMTLADRLEYGYVRTVGGINSNTFVIGLDMSQPVTNILETVSHEVGHIVMWDAFDRLPMEQKAEVVDAYRAWKASTAMMSDQQLVAATRGVAASRRFNKARQEEVNAGRTGSLTADEREYYSSFDEWFADQVARWATTSEVPRSTVEKFFADVARLLRDLVQALFGTQQYVDPSMQKLLDGMAAVQEGMQPTWEQGAQSTEDLSAQERSSAERTAETLRGVSDQVAKAAERLKLNTTGESFRRLSMGWSTVTNLATTYKRLFNLDGGLNGLEKLPEVEQARSSTAAHFAQLFDKAYSAFKALEKTSPKVAETVGRLMRYTEHDVDPSKTWEQHTWLHTYTTDAKGTKTIVPDPRMQEIIKNANDLWSQLTRSGKQDVYTNLKLANETIHYAQMSMDLYATLVVDPSYRNIGLPGFSTNPVDDFKQPGTGRAETIENARDFWKARTEQQVQAIKDFSAQQAGFSSTLETDAERRQIEVKLKPLLAKARMTETYMQKMEQSPYFHLGRTGNFFVSFGVRRVAVPGQGYRVDKVALEKVAAALEAAGITGAEISRDTLKSGVFMRFENEVQADRAYEVVRALQQQGLVESKQTKFKNEQGETIEGLDIRKGTRENMFAASNVSPAWVQRLIADIESSPALQVSEDMTDEERAAVTNARERTIAQIREMVVDMLPDMSITKVLSQRKAIPGYNRDMIQSFAQRMQVGVITLANLEAEPKRLEAYSQMKAAINNAQQDETSPRDVRAMQEVYGELLRRNVERSRNAGTDVWDQLRAVNHAYFLGLSPAYFLVNTSQLGVLLWPELGKKHGFVAAAKAIGNATPMALRILKATWEVGRQSGRATDAIISEEILAKAGVPKETAKFIMNVAMTGALDIGSASRELGRVAEGMQDSMFDRGLRMASFMSYYSETGSRLVAALATRELEGPDSPNLQRRVGTVLNEAMFNFSSWNAARQMGKSGVLGPFTPVAFSFMSYQAQLLEKLYRETYAAFSAGATTEAEKKEARKFLGAHMAATTVFAGTLGLPFASVLARAAEKLVDLFGDDDDEPYDIKAAWRTFLAQTFGKDVGEVLARGLPRAIGQDWSTRAGEQDILPFSRLLTDRRQFKDAASDWAVSLLGSPVSMTMNVLKGGEAMAAGDVMQGLDQMLPSSLKGVERAFRMTDEGYTDTAGNRLPMSPTAAEILAQALGFTPAQKAEYTEARMTQTNRKAQLTTRASALRRQLASAYERGDTDAFREVFREAQAFDRANPANAVLPDLPAAIRRRATARQQSRLTMTPLGTNVRDPGARQLTAFANF